MRMGLAVVDITTGLYSVIGILLAMHERERSGRGQFIDMALYDSALSLMHPHFANYFISGKVPGLTGNTHGNLATSVQMIRLVSEPFTLERHVKIVDWLPWHHTFGGNAQFNNNQATSVLPMGGRPKAIELTAGLPPHDGNLTAR